MGEETDTALRARAEYEAAGGNLAQGIGTYNQALELALHAGPKPEDHLDEAFDLSDLWLALARLHRRAGQAAEQAALDGRRLELWRHWERKLPGNPFVLRQLAQK